MGTAMKHNFIVYLLGFSILIFPLLNQASIIQIYNPGNMYQGPYNLVDFEDDSDFFVNSDGHMESMHGVTFYSSDREVNFADANMWANGVTPSGNRGLITYPYISAFPRPIIMDFLRPTSSVGMFFGNDDPCCSSGFNASLDIFGLYGYLDTITVTANMNDDADQYIGFVSDDLITSVVIRYPTLSNEIGLITYIDDVQFNVVPEPPAILLMAAGLAGLGFVSRKKSTKV
jgi:hypothetical protein